MVERTPPSALPGISPSRGEISWAVPLAPISIAWADANHESISPLEGEMSGRTEGGSHTRQYLRGHLHAH
jgi:hypothetical protein